jgi:hypothetical protein
MAFGHDFAKDHLVVDSTCRIPTHLRGEKKFEKTKLGWGWIEPPKAIKTQKQSTSSQSKHKNNQPRFIKKLKKTKNNNAW